MRFDSALVVRGTTVQKALKQRREKTSMQMDEEHVGVGGQTDCTRVSVTGSTAHKRELRANWRERPRVSERE